MLLRPGELEPGGSLWIRAWHLERPNQLETEVYDSVGQEYLALIDTSVPSLRVVNTRWTREHPPGTEELVVDCVLQVPAQEAGLLMSAAQVILESRGFDQW